MQVCPEGICIVAGDVIQAGVKSVQEYVASSAEETRLYSKEVKKLAAWWCEHNLNTSPTKTSLGRNCWWLFTTAPSRVSSPTASWLGGRRENAADHRLCPTISEGLNWQTVSQKTAAHLSHLGQHLFSLMPPDRKYRCLISRTARQRNG